MIHAYLFVTSGHRGRDGHGPDFQVILYIFLILLKLYIFQFPESHASYKSNGWHENHHIPFIPQRSFTLQAREFCKCVVIIYLLQMVMAMVVMHFFIEISTLYLLKISFFCSKISNFRHPQTSSPSSSSSSSKKSSSRPANTIISGLRTKSSNSNGLLSKPTVSASPSARAIQIPVGSGRKSGGGKGPAASALNSTFSNGRGLAAADKDEEQPQIEATQ
jgi:hypothetical protein